MKNWLIVLLVVIGVGVGAISLYMASLYGVMTKMGLVGGDLHQSIDVNELARQLRSMENQPNCGIINVSKKIPYYLSLQGESRAQLAGELGRERIGCGIKYVQIGNVERGVYTLVKGLYYLKNHYGEIREMVEMDRTKCSLLGDSLYESWIEGYLLATKGRAQQVVWEVYKQVEGERARVEELCTD
ncbi:MAG: hypothetical protein UX62_C0042G0004 [Microgenomates group bacterium GW2011_GWA2_46_7]|nr:MAG: hypothetical protein UX62_C0042G0004 [Microgenomates group bacterium GW2011_GWA2_46_7]KKU46099.1 MAG: hypothetical protein UX64_C0013G0004 [Microgenomates group bacterium GW2011_GWC2_46_7]